MPEELNPNPDGCRGAILAILVEAIFFGLIIWAVFLR
jgi:hypothetical protein